MLSDSLNDNDRSFTGHVEDTDTGLTYMQARYYHPVTGRFLSSDPVGFSLENPEYFNRYSYAANDPINNYDPDGRETKRHDTFRDATNHAVNHILPETGTNRNSANRSELRTDMNVARSRNTTMIEAGNYSGDGRRSTGAASSGVRKKGFVEKMFSSGN